MADQQERFDFAEMRGTINGLLDGMEKQRNNLKTENGQLKSENTILKETMDEKEREIKKLNEELLVAKKTIDVLDPTGTGQRIVDHAHLFQTKEIDKLTEKIISLEAKNAEHLKLIELLQRAELDKTNRTNGQAGSRVNRKRKAETSLEMNAETPCNGK